MTEFKEILKDPENKVTKQWAQAIEEDLRKKCGFKGRFGSKDKSIHKQVADIVDIIDPETKFFSLAKYIEKYGEPKATGAKVVSLRSRGGKLIRGVVVRVGEEGRRVGEGQFMPKEAHGPNIPSIVFLLLVLILVYRRFKLSRKREYLK